VSGKASSVAASSSSADSEPLGISAARRCSRSAGIGGQAARSLAHCSVFTFSHRLLWDGWLPPNSI
jgi:hypothetical protein